MLLLAVLLLSAASLAWEILLLRILSVADWHNFAWMVISLALLGYGAGGTILALFRERLVRSFDVVAPALALLFSVSSGASVAGVRRIPLNSLELVWDPRQYGYLFAAYTLLAVPFVFSSMFIGLCLSKHTSHISKVYRADLAGAGLGAAAVVLGMHVLAPSTLSRMIILAGLLATAVVLDTSNLRLARRALIAIAFILFAAVALVVPEDQLSASMSEFKPLSQTLRIPGMSVIDRRTTPLGEIHVVAAREVPFRHAPGLSLNWTTPLPDQLGIFLDGMGPMTVDEASSDESEIGYVDHLTDALPYHMIEGDRDPGAVLVLGARGGVDLLTALRHDAASIDAVELHPDIVSLISSRIDGFPSLADDQRRVRWHIVAPRAFLARNPRTFRLIVVRDTGEEGVARGLSTNYVLTVEGFDLILEHLDPDGFIIVGFDLQIPPRAVPRFLAIASDSLARRGIQPANSVILIRNWDRVAVLIKNGVLSGDEIRSARRFCETRSFDLDWYPGIEPGEPSRVHQIPAPYFFDLAEAILSGAESRTAITERYKFRIDPTSDDHPFFLQFFRWSSLPEILDLRRKGGAPLIEWGYLVVLATLAQAVLLSAFLTSVSLVPILRRRTPPAVLTRTVLFFGSIGVAFLALEIVLIHRMTLVLFHPIYSTATVISGVLLCAGIGSGCAGPIQSWARRTIRFDVIPLIVLSIGASALVTHLLLSMASETLLGVGPAARLLLALLLIAPCGFLMGLPFPLALSRLRGAESKLIPLAWAVNGCASVVAAILANLLALEIGFRFVLLCAVTLYAVSSLVIPGALNEETRLAD